MTSLSSAPAPASLSKQKYRSPIPPSPATRQLSAEQGPLVWIDCEMTGLHADQGDRLLEIACIITDGNLEPLDQGISYTFRTDKHVLDAMNDWCIEQHGKSGLTSDCLDSSISYEHADIRAAVLAYVRDRVPRPSSAVLAGNTVHADKVFLAKELPELVNHLHYRIVDVSSVKEVVKRWYGAQAVFKHDDGKEGEGRSDGKDILQPHRALYDIMASIQELRYYRQNFFR